MYFLAPAMEMAPAGSSMARESSKQSRTAAQISSLLTVTRSSTSSLQMRKTSGPICATAAPSTKWPGSGRETRCPLSKLRLSTSLSEGSTPMTLVPGMICFTAAATPARSEPPPHGTKIASRCVRAVASGAAADGSDSLIAAPCCRTSSRPTVAWVGVGVGVESHLGTG